LGYDIHGKLWYWPDKMHVMQGIVLGTTGSGKPRFPRTSSRRTWREWSIPNDPHLPMVIFDGKGDLEFLYDLLPHVHRTGRACINSAS
jgi:hypothetical protein